MSSNYKDSKNSQKYWYFRFSDDFWDFEIMQMENIPRGYEFVVILLKLYTLSLKKKGTLQIPINKTTGGMDVIEVARWLRHDLQVVLQAINYFMDNGFLEVMQTVSSDDILQGFTFDFPDVKKRIGSRTRGADSKQEYNRKNI